MSDTAPSSPTPDPAAERRERANRLARARRWTRNDLDTLQALTEALATAERVDETAFVGGSEGRARSLRSLVILELATIDAGTIAMDADARAVAADLLAWNAKKQQTAVSRQQKGEDLKSAIARAVQTTFPGIPGEVAVGAATRLAPALAKLNRLPSQQAMVDAVAAIRLERWRQAVTSEREVAEKLQARQVRGDTNRAVKRFRDQRAIERVEEEMRQWRGDLGPVTSHRLR